MSDDDLKLAFADVSRQLEANQMFQVLALTSLAAHLNAAGKLDSVQWLDSLRRLGSNSALPIPTVAALSLLEKAMMEQLAAPSKL